MESCSKCCKTQHDQPLALAPTQESAEARGATQNHSNSDARGARVRDGTREPRMRTQVDRSWLGLLARGARGEEGL
eukprot:scaffold311142_cov35-Tisochrysis_lutea.AAC.1